MITLNPKMLNEHPRVAISAEIMAGTPCIKGTRIPLYIILDNVAAGKNFKEILDNYPTLTREDLQAAIRFSSHLTSSLAHPSR